MVERVLDARQQRALAIVRSDKAKRIKHVAGSRWLVPSQSNASGGYVVDADQRTCSCPDHEDRGSQCKHIWAVLYFRSEALTEELGRRDDAKASASSGKIL